MARYRLHETYIYRDDGAIIPIDGGNTDYLEYLKWIATGNTPDPFVDDSWRLVVPGEFKLRRDIYQARITAIATFGDATVKNAAKDFWVGLWNIFDYSTVITATTREELKSALTSRYTQLLNNAIAAAPTAEAQFRKVNDQ